MITFSMLGNYGRFGNQLWQIASTVGIARKNNQSYSFPWWEYQQYFPNKASIGFITDEVKLWGIYEEKDSSYRDINLSDEYNWDLRGYFQSYKYFEDYEDEIRMLFESKIQTNESNLDHVAVHVRRGDYLELKDIHPNLELDYYKRAMSLFPNREFDIFSDDIEWCKNNFDREICTFILPTDTITDFLFMSRHSDFIIANSSYSWWAAWLNPSKDKKVICPSIWVSNEPIEVMEDRIPKEWVRI